MLLLGKDLSSAAAQASLIPDVSKVLVVDDPIYATTLPEDIAPVVAQAAAKYTHVLASASNLYKSVLPRAAALCDVAPLTDVVAVVDEATFKRPIYAGNAIATVTMTDKIKVRLKYYIHALF